VAEGPSAAPRIAVVGVSINPICGVRDHATLLARELESGGASCTMHWLTRSERSLRGSRTEIHAWLERLAAELRDGSTDVVLLHYSVFSYAHAGVPLFVRPLASVLRRAGIPTVAVLHEIAYSWSSAGVRGKVWALTQRAAFVEVMRVSVAALATIDARAQWIGSRRWLPERPLAVAPVFSNLPAPVAGTERKRDTVGLFGYAYDEAATPLVLDALRRLVDERGETRLLLLGAPGGESPAALRWRAAAETRGLADALLFSGTLSARELSNALASCEVLLFVASAGPSSRKGTLAAALASGRPVVAVDGPNRWEELARSDAALIVKPSAEALAEAVGGLLADEVEREALGARSLAFSRERMSVARTAETVRDLIERDGALKRSR
jgi:glycosyltransferase involved in cell wall biosynthesis